jgi:hypothetical protein
MSRAAKAAQWNRNPGTGKLCRAGTQQSNRTFLSTGARRIPAATAEDDMTAFKSKLSLCIRKSSHSVKILMCLSAEHPPDDTISPSFFQDISGTFHSEPDTDWCREV